MLNRYAHALFCDEIRREDSGKFLFIGVYTQRMIVDRFPVRLPTFAILVDAVTPVDSPFEWLTLTITKDGDVLRRMKLNASRLPSATQHQLQIERAQDAGDELEIFTIKAHARFSPLNLESPGTLRVVVETDDGTYLAGKLAIAPADTEATRKNDQETSHED